MTERKDMLVPIATQAVVQILRAISPPTMLVHVGWGNGMGDLTQWTQWQVPNAVVIEAEESKAAACQAQALALAQTLEPPNKPWQTIHATLSAQNAEQTYYLASNPSESGLLPPDSLQHAWPHLQTAATQTIATRSLDELWQDISSHWPLTQSEGHTWLIIDCLPAADILSGGVKALQSAQVLCARSLLANRASLSEQMRSAGWIEVGWAESQHPAFGHAWFLRDIATELDQASQSQAQLAAERDALAQSKEAETVAKTQALAERDALAQVKAVLESQLEALEKAIAESRAKLGINSQVQMDLKGQLSAITQAQVELQSALESAAQQQAQLTAVRDALEQAKEVETTAKTQALAERDALAKAKDAETDAKNQALAERDALAQSKAQLQSQLEALEKAIADSRAHLGINSQAQTDLKGHLTAITQAQVDLQSALEEATKRYTQLAAERDALVKAKEVEATAKTQALGERDALAKAKEAETAAANKAKTEKDALAKEKQTLETKHKESQERLQQLETANQDLQNRQHLQHEELVKAEAQIELIKDLLLREQGI
ncbi:MAG: hypothetical protein ACOVN3_03775 [Limnohabitans sp.]